MNCQGTSTESTSRGFNSKGKSSTGHQHFKMDEKRLFAVG